MIQSGPVTGVHNDADDWTDDNSDYIDDCDDGFTKDVVETVTHNKKAACVVIFDQHFQQQVFGHLPKAVKLEWSNKNAKSDAKWTFWARATSECFPCSYSRGRFNFAI